MLPISVSCNTRHVGDVVYGVCVSVRVFCECIYMQVFCLNGTVNLQNYPPSENLKMRHFSLQKRLIAIAKSFLKD